MRYVAEPHVSGLWSVIDMHTWRTPLPYFSSMRVYATLLCKDEQEANAVAAHLNTRKERGLGTLLELTIIIDEQMIGIRGPDYWVPLEPGTPTQITPAPGRWYQGVYSGYDEERGAHVWRWCDDPTFMIGLLTGMRCRVEVDG